ncbi:hypothetical protein IMG5_128250, partial [Ichthyophthirius multifiliis]
MQNQENKTQNQEKTTIRHPRLDKILFYQMILFYNNQQKPKQSYSKIQTTKDWFDNFFFKDCRDPNYSYTILRLLLPVYDKERGAFGLKEKVLADIFSKALPPSKDILNRLRFYKNATYQPHQAPIGDFGDVLKHVLDDFCPTMHVITINQVDENLNKLAQAQTKEEQIEIIRFLIKQCTSEEMKWIARLILKDLKIGINHDKTLTLFHQDALALFNTTSSLREVCNEFQDKNHRLQEVMRIFYPIRPMLAQKKSLKDIQYILEGKDFLIETKYDGERIQCHVTENEIRFFTRNSHNYTNIYHKMCVIVRHGISQEINECILDGEMVVLEKESGQSVQFGMNKVVALSNEDTDFCICYKVFDILYIKTKNGNDVNLLSSTLKERKEVLKSAIVNEIKYQLEIIQGNEYSRQEDILNEFNEAMNNNEEGIIIKQLDSQYVPDERSNKWIKMKGDYYEGITDTLDLIVLGAFLGNKSYKTSGIGDWTDCLTHFLLGISSYIDKNVPTNSVFLPFCKVGTGYTDEILRTIKIKLRDQWVRTSNLPSFVQNCKLQKSDKPEAFINSPDNSLIFEVRASEIINSHNFPTHYTLRFPRFEKLRTDKDWYECMTLEDLQQMKNNLSKKQGESDAEKSQKEDGEDNNEQGTRSPKKRKQIKRNHQEYANQIMQQYQQIDVSQVNLVSQLFIGFVFNIINCEEGEKQNLQFSIISNNGQVFQNDSGKVTHYLAYMHDFRVQAIINNYKVNVLKPKWVFDCIKRKEILDYAPKYITFAQEELKQRNIALYDKYGDPYFKEIDVEELRDILENMSCDDEIFEKDK